MSRVAIQAFVLGKVQGVFYRRETVVKAKSLGLTGFVRNLDDGRVEVIMSGEQSCVNELIEWLWTGPKAAEVKSVECHELNDIHDIHEGFIQK